MTPRPVRYCTFCDLELPIKLQQIGYPARPPNANERSKATHVAYTQMAGGDMAQFACEAHAFRWMNVSSKDFFGPADPHLPTFPKDHYLRPIEEFWEDLDVKDAEARLIAMDRRLTGMPLMSVGPNVRCCDCGHTHLKHDLNCGCLVGGCGCQEFRQ